MAASGADAPAVFQFVRKNCVACHNTANASGDVNLQNYKEPKAFDEHREVWERVASKLRTNEMPPPGFPRPPAAESKAVQDFLAAEFLRQDRTAKPDPGRVTARRLNRTEYNNTVRDLLGVDIRPADNFPNDESAFGFDNISDALNISPVLTEKYLYAAERAVRTAIFGPEKLKPAVVHYPFPVRMNERLGTVGQVPATYDLTGLSTRHSAHVTHRFPVDGEYSFKIVLNGHRPNQSEPAIPALYIDGKLVQQWEVDATDLEGQFVECRLKVTAGEHLLSATYLKNYHGLPPQYKGPEPSKRPAEALITTKGQLTEKDIETLRKLGTKIKTDRVETRIDNRYESIDIGGPFTQPTGPSMESTRKVFVCSQQTTACADTIIRNFARRAFRRPVTPSETARYAKLYTLARQQGDSFKEGIATALQGVLVSPNFLFRIERDQPGKPIAPISDLELASRLSYFLWSSMPDEELLTLASANRLRPALPAQIKRMLADPKSRALVDNFAGQWLQFSNIDVLKPDPTKFPDFEDSLRLAMRRETEYFLTDLIRRDGSILEILDAKHTFVNERLARFYGIPGVEGPEFRRVDMSNSKRGGGVLAHGSILTISSYSTRTSPVLRGKWILENLLNAPPPPPPPGVPTLDEGKAGESASLRQQMEVHRSNAVCASCHQRMDPLGFGLENLNAIGQWRDMDGKFPIDPSGQLPDGRTFQGPQALKKLLTDNSTQFSEAVTDKLLTYALGRGLERYDKRIVREIAANLPKRNYAFSALVENIVNSLPFQQRRSATIQKPNGASTEE